MTDHQDRSTPDDVVIARLRSALDELTAGAGEHVVLDSDATIPVRPVRQARHYRWVVPTLAAAALIAVLVGVALRPEQHTTTPAESVPETPAPAVLPTIPWYELDLPTVSDVSIYGESPSAVFASVGYDRMLRVRAIPGNGVKDLGRDGARQIDVPVGRAWFAERSDGGPSRFVYWTTGEAVITVEAYGFDEQALVDVLPMLSVEPVGEGLRVVSAVSSLSPQQPDVDPNSLAWQYQQMYSIDGSGDGARSATLRVSGPGMGPALQWSLDQADDVETVTTPFGPGIKITTDAEAQIIWHVAGSDYWAGVSARADLVDQALATVRQVESIVPPEPDAPQTEAPIEAPVPAVDEVTPSPVNVPTVAVPSKYVLAIDAAVESDVVTVDGGSSILIHVADDYSEVVTLTFTGVPVSEHPEPERDVEAIPIDGMTDGTARLVAARTSGGRTLPARQVHWTPSEGDVVIVSAYGLSQDALIKVARGLSILGPDSIDSAQYGAFAMGTAVDPSPFLTQTDTYRLADGSTASITNSPGGFDAAISDAAASADLIEPAKTPFGSGVRIETPDGNTAVWWIDDTGMATGLTGPTDQIDRLLQMVQVG